MNLWELLGAGGANFGTLTPQEQAATPPNMLEKIVLGLGRSMGNAAMAPGRAYQSTPANPVTTEQMIAPAADLAGMVTLGAGAMPSGANDLRMGIKAYHGSPHDFDKFDIGKIGTGEGAQAYGHGLYFAEKEGTARSYRDALSDLKPRALEGASPDLTLPSWVAKTVESRNPIAINDMKADFQGRLADMRRQLADPNTMQPWVIESNIPGIENVLKAIDHFESGAKLKPAGRMYEVDINAKPEQFLDWDKPLALKTPIREMIADLGMKGTGSPYADVRNASKDVFLSAQSPNLTGEGAYRSLARAAVKPDDIRPGFDARSPTAATDMLREAGIPGIKYLDQGSRAAGDGSRNYVVFDPSIIEILRKYGIAGIPAAGAAASQLPPPGQPAPQFY